MNHSDFKIVVILGAFAYTIWNLFIFCNFGKFVTQSFEKMANRIYESNWLDLSPNLQKYIVMMIANAQRPIYYSAFEIVYMNLHTFTSVREFFLPFF